MASVAAGWITVPGKGRRWRTAQGEYLMQRPAGGAPGVMGAIRDAWKGADRALGGWLPGGGTPNALTEGYDRPSGQVASVARRVGISPDSFKVAYLDKKRPLMNKVALQLNRAGLNPWGGVAGYAGREPLNGPIIAVDKGQGQSRYSENLIVHELGHLQGEQVPDGGRALAILSNATGNPPLLKFASGLLHHLDAKDEDKAERFTAAHRGAQAATIHPDGTSGYGNRLREEGNKMMMDAVDPLGLGRGIARAAGGAIQNAQRGIRDWQNGGNFDDYVQATKTYLELTDKESDTGYSDNTRQAIRRAAALKKPLLDSGYSEDEIHDRLLKRLRPTGQ